MINNYIGEKDIIAFSEIVNKMRQFCLKKGFVEVNTQDRLSILAACEDPLTVATFNYAGQVWPLPQTGQMWLEYELLTKPELPGVFCLSTSFRNEKKPIPGRHRIIFPMFEFELKGTLSDLEKFEVEILEYLGFGAKKTYFHKSYDELKNYYGVEELKTEHENKMLKDFGPIVFCKEFPSYTSPFWNMRRRNKNYAEKIDVIMYGNETIGSAERSTNPEEMRREFYTISKGKYAKQLFNLFGKERTEKELNEFLSLKFFPRCGAGIGMTRIIAASEKLKRMK
ncbi:MAG: tRNA ligase [Parcubacteria group bacterium GW2011_GWC1_36_9]|uniref:tRNA ligase n=1 Tax=Candidatus Yanofskybacteria bacterium GW2011_GWC2_37_9 TaxID=1619028 RepID=A0A0G0KDA7_9BACT|nr:MAG: tRNA ligase [Parcubacteria group bacterium GW2011_GWC1_36_9]KKQ26841.1 MAG: tRNA ligase [Parcubacteria group bacterium GW2011_GWB1_37_13]KKQ47099.1 MAG: tRNA ligase [Candidatus Yanofskybacteria bacterium GW2011_GWC2_37_9]